MPQPDLGDRRTKERAKRPEVTAGAGGDEQHSRTGTRVIRARRVRYGHMGGGGGGVVAGARGQFSYPKY